jgi:diacylglycerol kinase (ATP)
LPLAVVTRRLIMRGRRSAAAIVMAGTMGGLLGGWAGGRDRMGGDGLVLGLAYGLGRIAPAMRSPMAGVGLVSYVLLGRSRSRSLARVSSSWMAAALAARAGTGLMERLASRRPARGTRRAVAIVVNSDSGSSRLARRGVRALRREPVELISVERTPADELAGALRRATDRLGPDGVLVVAGGDGTVGTAAEIIAQTGHVLAIIPTGTGNDVARSLQIPLSPEEAAGTVARGSIVAMDLGTTSAGRFAHALTIGMTCRFADLVRDERGWRRPLRYPVCAYRAWRERRPLAIDLQIDGQRVTIDQPPFQIAIVNAPRLGGRIGVDLPGARVDDGVLHLVVLSSGALRHIIGAIAHLLRAGVQQAPKRALVVGGRSFQLETEAPEVVSLDGEPMTVTPLAAEVVAGACEVVVPALATRWRSQP